MSENKKVIIIGAGHNGLVAAAYLGRAGFNVEVLERRDVIGGAAITEEWFKGYHISTCSYICHILQKKVIDDLELRKYGFHVYPIDPSRIIPFPNGKIVKLWHDDKKTSEEIRKISEYDANAWLEWAKFWHKAVEILSQYYLTTPPSLSELTEKFRMLGEEDLLVTLLTVPLRDLIDRFFESDEIKAVVSTGSFDMGDISAPGSAYITALYGYSAYREDTENFGIVRGGMGGITQSIANSAKDYGVVIRTNTEVNNIISHSGKVTGIQLLNGEIINADLIVSNADPKTTYLKLLENSNIDADFINKIKELKTDSASAKVLCSLKRLPDFSAYLGPNYDVTNLAMIKLCPSMDYVETSWNDSLNGIVTNKPMIQVQIPSVHDNSVAPKGHHVLSMWVYFLPPHIKDNTWENIKEEFGETLIDEVSKYAPDFRDCIIDWTILSPEDIEERVGLTDGNIRHIDMLPQQMMSSRPLPGWSEYKTPIDGLYLCGAGTHPGGEVSGAPGHNAAHVIINEFNLNN